MTEFSITIKVGTTSSWQKLIRCERLYFKVRVTVANLTKVVRDGKSYASHKCHVEIFVLKMHLIIGLFSQRKLIGSKSTRKQSSKDFYMTLHPSGGFSAKIRGSEVLNFPSILEVVEYLLSIGRVYLFFIASQPVGRRRFEPRPSHTKDFKKMILIAFSSEARHKRKEWES